jgi:hypothetical protein
MPPFSSAISAAFLIFLASGCSKASLPSDQSKSEPAPGAEKGTPSTPGANTGGNKSGMNASQQADWNSIEQLEAQAKAIAVLDGCPSASDCRSAPVGSRGCGGPRYYIPWCAKTTDSAALYRKLAEVAAAEQAYNKKYEIMSTCEFRMPPLVESSGGSCIVK